MTIDIWNIVSWVTISGNGQNTITRRHLFDVWYERCVLRLPEQTTTIIKEAAAHVKSAVTFDGILYTWSR